MDNLDGKRDSDYSFEQIPQFAKKGFLAMFFIMLGFTFFSASMSVGARLGNGLDLSSFITAIVLGGLFLGAYTGFLGYIGSDTGLSFDLLARQSFGSVGSYLPSAMIGFTQIGWFGVGVAMFAIPAAEVLHCNPYILVAIAGICMTASAYFGIRSLEIISYISVPLIAVLGIYSMMDAASAGGGFAVVFSKSTGQLSMVTAIGMVIGSFLSGGTTTPNFTRFARNNSTAVVTTVIAFFLGNSLMFLFGAVGGAFTGKDDIFYVMMTQGLIIPALVVLGANIWTTNDNAIYSGALSLSNITKARKKPLVIIAGTIGTVFAIWLYNNFCGWLIFLNATLPPIGAIIIMDFLRNPRKYRCNAPVTEVVNWGGVIGVIAGAAVGNFVTWGVASINAMVVACVCYYVFNRGK